MVSGKKEVQSGQFYTIANDSYEEKYGFSKGQTVLIVGDGFFPISEEDIYLYRKYFAVIKFENGTMDINQRPIVIAAEGLEEISDELQESFQKLLRAFEEAMPQQAANS